MQQDTVAPPDVEATEVGGRTLAGDEGQEWSAGDFDICVECYSFVLHVTINANRICDVEAANKQQVWRISCEH
jgi:hypothetical protein